MSILDEDRTLEYDENTTEKKLFISQTLLDNTLCIAGSSFKGPAFVPLHITNQTIDEEVSNTLTNSIGKDRQHSLGHIFDELNYHVDSQSYDAINMWLQNGGQQASFVRILGNDITHSGFNAEDITKSIYSLENNNNVFTIPGSDELGSTNLITRQYSSRQIKINDDITLDSFEEMGITTPTKNFITDVIICPKGVVPYFSNVTLDSLDSELANFYNEPADYDADLAEVENRFLIEKNINKEDIVQYPTIIFRGHDPGKLNDESENSLRQNRTFIDLKQNNLSKPISYNSRWFNFFPTKMYENGHHLYSTYYDGEFFELGDGTSTSYNLERKTTGSTFNNFKSSYTTAKTPWVISQAINSVEQTREKLHENVINLFKFFALDDGEVGNRFRIKINLKSRGDIVNNIFAIFNLYIMQYDARDNSFELLETYEDLNLNVDSENYIGRRIGTKRKFYDANHKKVFEEGLYDNVSLYLRVEINEDIEFQKLRCDLVPCGFRSYPILNDSNAMPVPYFTDYLEDNVLGDNNNIKNSWGVLFRKLTYSKAKSSLKLMSITPDTKDISPHYFYGKFFISNNLITNDETYNSLFSLEKLVVKKSLIDSVIVEEDFTLFYKRSGNLLTQPNPNSNIKYEYIDFNKLSYEENDARHYSIYEYDEDNERDTTVFNSLLRNKLSFDFFTYGGFDGTNIYDSDQKNLTGKAVSLESLSSDYALHQQGNVVTKSFTHATDLLVDYSNCNGDIIILPDIKDVNFIRNVINIIDDKRNFFYISNGIFDLDESSIFKNIVITPPRFFQTTNYIKDQVLFDSDLADNKILLLTNHQKNIIENNIQNTSLYSLGIDNRYYMSVVGDIIITPNIIAGEENNQQTKIIDPSIFAAAKMAQGIRNNITSKELIYNNRELSLVNSSILNSNYENFSLLQKNSRKKLFNFLHYAGDSKISLQSENTAYSIRRSIFTKQHQIRAIQFVKKVIMLNVFTDTLLIPGGILFSQIASLQNVYAKFNIQITNLLNALVEDNIINSYQIDIPISANDQTILDARNNIVRGSVTIKLNSAGTDDIIRLSIQNALNQLAFIQSIDDSIESELLLPASGF